jgi:Ca-activated chloride channel family protein
MSFIWPPFLVLLLAIPVGVAIYRRRDRRRAARAAAFGWVSASAVAAAPGVGASAGASSARWRWAWRRRLPAVLTIAGLTILVLSLARPQSVIGVPRLEGTVLLAFDVSGSMAATDVAPTRMEAAKATALAFIERAPASLRIGVIVFSDAGFSTQVPTYERPPVLAAIQRLEPERGTSLGRGILASLTAIDIADHPPEADYYTTGSPAPTPHPTPVSRGAHEPAIVVMFTDGENTEEPDPGEAVQAARDRGIRIDTVGIGTAAGTTLEIDGFAIHTSLDETVLQAIAAATDGTYYPATDQDDLTRVYDDVGSKLVVRTEPFELTPLFAIAGFTLLVVGGAVSLRWFGRMP